MHLLPSARQEALISRLTTVLAEKTGVDPNNPHYALNAADSTPRMASTGLLAPGAVPGSRPAEGVRSDVSADLNQRARGVLSGVEVQGSRLARPGNTEQGQDEPGVFL